jgi:hypothetical protein
VGSFQVLVRWNEMPGVQDLPQSLPAGPDWPVAGG